MADVLVARGVRAWFGASRVLEGVDVTLRGGEVHAIAGENGAGKSTFIRVVAGAHAGWDGALELDGHAVRFVDPASARRAGIATIHQELSLVGALTVAENLALASPRWLVDRRDDRRCAKAALDELDLDVDPDALVESLPIDVQQLVEIAKALAGAAKVVIFDEATSALAESEARVLFDRIDALKKRGAAVAFVSHRLDELERIADRVTVLRDGRVALSCAFVETSRSRIVEAMLGRAPEVVAETARTLDSSALLRVDDLSCAHATAVDRLVARDVSLSIARGSIVGLAGLRGSGASEILAAIAGARERSGRVLVDGRLVAPNDPRAASSARIAYVPADRQRHGVAPDLDVHESAMLAASARGSEVGVVDRARERALLAPRLAEIAVPASLLYRPMRALSGGTQQKIALLRALMIDPAVVVLDEPTRGVDVGAKAFIHDRLRAIAAGGAVILFFSSDAEELLALADRVVVLANGRVVADLARDEATRERIAAAAIGEERAA